MDGLQHVFQSWVDRWNKCKLCKGRYFENEWWSKVIWFSSVYIIELVHEIIDGPSYSENVKPLWEVEVDS